MQIPLVGQTYEHRYRDVNYQRCVNFYPCSSGEGNTGPAVLMPTPGFVLLSDLDSALSLGTNDLIRGMRTIGTDLFVCAGSSIYRLAFDMSTLTLTSSANEFTMSESGTPSNLVDMVHDEQYLVVTNNSGTIYYYDYGADSAGTVSAPSSITASGVVYLDGYFIVFDSVTGKLYRSDAGDPTTWGTLNFTTPEAKPDITVGIEVINRELWVFSDNSVEVFYNDGGDTNFGFTRRDAVLIDQGCKAKESIVRLDRTLFWLDDRGFIVRSGDQNGPYGMTIISTDALNKELQNYSDLTDAEAYGYTEDGHNFYVITFPTDDKTWVYDTTSGLWHERMWWGQQDVHPILTPIQEFSKSEHRHLSRQLELNQGENVISSYTANKLYVMSNIYYEDEGEPIIRIRTTPSVSQDLSFFPIDAVELHVDTGQAPVSGDGSSPELKLRYSWDGGYTWSHEMVESMGLTGEYGTRVRWNRLGTGREWVFEFRLVDNAGTAFISAHADLRSLAMES